MTSEDKVWAAIEALHEAFTEAGIKGMVVSRYEGDTSEGVITDRFIEALEQWVEGTGSRVLFLERLEGEDGVNEVTLEQLREFFPELDISVKAEKVDNCVRLWNRIESELEFRCPGCGRFRKVMVDKIDPDKPRGSTNRLFTVTCHLCQIAGHGNDPCEAAEAFKEDHRRDPRFKDCDHKWTHDGDGALYCSECGEKDLFSNEGPSLVSLDVRAFMALDEDARARVCMAAGLDLPDHYDQIRGEKGWLTVLEPLSGNGDLVLKVSKLIQAENDRPVRDGVPDVSRNDFKRGWSKAVEDIKRGVDHTPWGTNPEDWPDWFVCGYNAAFNRLNGNITRYARLGIQWGCEDPRKGL